jgi:hypothetical protein
MKSQRILISSPRLASPIIKLGLALSGAPRMNLRPPPVAASTTASTVRRPTLGAGVEVIPAPPCIFCMENR